MMIIRWIYYKIQQKKKLFSVKIYGFYAKIRLKNAKFTIICNNCYGGHIYQSLQTQYNTPTVGLYFFAEDYIHFLENLEECLSSELKFINSSKYEECQEEYQKLKYPIGLLLNKIEIHFLHYNSEEEAKEKWNRRKERIDYNNLFVIMNDQNRFKNNHLVKFNALKFHKVFLSSKHINMSNVVWVKTYRNKLFVGDMYNDWLKCLPYFDLVKWIRKGI